MAGKNTVKSLNKETGELNDLYLQFTEQIPTDGSMRFGGTVGKNTSYEDIQIYEAKKKAAAHSSEDPFWGKMVDMSSDKRRYTMLFDGSDEYRIELSSNAYYKYWYEIQFSLHWNSNIVISKKPRIHPIQDVEEFCKIFDAGKSTTYKFLQECKDKGYIAKIDFLGQSFWVANPLYGRKGSTMPIKLLDLFKFGKDFVEGKLNRPHEVSDEE